MDVGDDRDAHRRRRTLLVLAAGVGIWAVAAILLLRTRTPGLDLPALDPRVVVPRPPSSIGSTPYRTVTRWLWVASTVVELGVLGLLAWKARPLAASMQRCFACPVPPGPNRCRAGRVLLARSLARGASARSGGALVGAALRALRAGISRVARRPDRVACGHAVVVAPRSPVPSALAVRLRPSLVDPGGVAVAGARRSRRACPAARHRAALQPLLAACRTGLSPLRIEELGSRLGVGVESVEVVDASRRTTAANAMVTGIGPTRHVVLYDTLLDGRFTPDEIACGFRARARARRPAPCLEGRRLVRALRDPGDRARRLGDGTARRPAGSGARPARAPLRVLALGR